MKSPRIFPGIIFVLMGGHLCVVAVTAFLASSDKSFAVEADYYQKALNWDATQRQNTRNHELGWTARVEVAGAGTQRMVRVRLDDRDGRPLDGAGVRLVAFHNARAGEKLEATLSEIGPGMYGAEMDLSRPGQWQFRIAVRRGVEAFTASLEQSVGIGAGDNP